LVSTNNPVVRALLSSSRTASNVFGIYGDEVEYDDGAHGEGAESVGEGVESIVGDHGDEQKLRKKRDVGELGFNPGPWQLCENAPLNTLVVGGCNRETF
jgi:hypothetical protein